MTFPTLWPTPTSSIVSDTRLKREESSLSSLSPHAIASIYLYFLLHECYGHGAVRAASSAKNGQCRKMTIETGAVNSRRNFNSPSVVRQEKLVVLHSTPLKALFIKDVQK